jgi:hypothetical protein
LGKSWEIRRKIGLLSKNFSTIGLQEKNREKLDYLGKLGGKYGIEDSMFNLKSATRDMSLERF